MIKRANGTINELIIPKETDRDGSFIAYDNGVVYDIETGLEWVVGTDKDTTWDEALEWVENLTDDGGTCLPKKNCELFMKRKREHVI